MNIAQDVSLVITTYNNPPFLELVLKSVLRQHALPREVIIADDGSNDETRQLIDRYRKEFPVRLLHSWIPDEGFRVAKSRNVAVAMASGAYIILIDGDILVSPHFIEDHVSLRAPGYFVTGSRARLLRQATESRVRSLDPCIGFFSKGLKRRLVMLRMPWLNPWFKGYRDLRHARSCHLALWRDDYLRANGFEEKFVGWGIEDSEFIQRLFNNGLKRKNAKLMAPAVHLYHPEKSTEHTAENEQMFRETVSSGRCRAVTGIDQYL
ncbi:MAG: glycosyltransferase family 2 protein [Prevotella sp.]|nr:glycosyltransferase family 2 protein [Prevotella sp.]